MHPLNALPHGLFSDVAHHLDPDDRARLTTVDQAFCDDDRDRHRSPSPRSQRYYRDAQQAEWGPTALNNPAHEGAGVPTAPASYQQRQHASRRAAQRVAQPGNSLQSYPDRLEAEQPELSRRYGYVPAAREGIRLLRTFQWEWDPSQSPDRVRTADYLATRDCVRGLLDGAHVASRSRAEVAGEFEGVRPPHFILEMSPSVLRAPRRAPPPLNAEQVFGGAQGPMGLEQIFEQAQAAGALVNEAQD